MAHVGVPDQSIKAGTGRKGPEMELHQVEVGREYIYHGICGPAIARAVQVRLDGWVKLGVPALGDMGLPIVVEDWAHASDLEPLTAGADEEETGHHIAVHAVGTL
jgi:hypothetical protein